MPSSSPACATPVAASNTLITAARGRNALPATLNAPLPTFLARFLPLARLLFARDLPPFLPLSPVLTAAPLGDPLGFALPAPLPPAPGNKPFIALNGDSNVAPSPDNAPEIIPPKPVNAAKGNSELNMPPFVF